LEAKSKLESSKTEQLLIQAVNTLKQINNKLDEMIKSNERILEVNETLLQRLISGEINPKVKSSPQPDVMALLSLPSALRKTAMVLYKLEQATADDLSKETKRLRAVESASANELFRLGYIKKRREGRDVYFYIDPNEETKE
jgi:DNA-binding transcriptional ArsR family regulator